MRLEMSVEDSRDSRSESDGAIVRRVRMVSLLWDGLSQIMLPKKDERFGFLY